MHYENWISYRYLTASKGRFLTFLNFISIAGVAIGVMALIVVTGVMTGFGNNLREKIIGTTPHVVIEKETGITHYQDIQDKVVNLEQIVGTAPYIQGNVVLEDHGQSMSQVVRGIVPAQEEKVTEVTKYIKQGALKDLDENSIIIGSELARYFGYKLGDDITLISLSSAMAGREWRYHLKVVGIFNTGMVDYDTSLIIIHFNKAQEILDIPPDRATGIGIRLKHPQNAIDVKKAIYNNIGYSYLVKTWIDINRNLFEALFLEKWGLFIILTLMVLVASFNIISTLIVTVTSKIHDIGILQSFGVPKKSIRRIFTKQGIYIGILGTFWGLVGGVTVSYILRTYVHVPAEIYSIDRVPVDLQLKDLLIIVASAMMISYMATIYPAAKAAKLEPVDALRYE